MLKDVDYYDAGVICSFLLHLLISVVHSVLDWEPILAQLVLQTGERRLINWAL